MNNLSKNIIIFISAIFTSGIIWLIINLFLLQKSPTLFVASQNIIHFNIINLDKIFFPIKKTEHKKIQKVQTLNTIKLKAIYEDGKDGFIIVEDKDSTFVNLNESYKGYKLTKILQTKVIFTKNNKNYILYLLSQNKQTPQNSNNSFSTKRYMSTIPRKEFLSYRFNVSQIWNNIGIDKDLDGYQIEYIKKGSIFDKMGLKVDDILLEVNGVKLTNDEEAWNLYKNSDKFHFFQIKIKRHNKIKVINYEIK